MIGVNHGATDERAAVRARVDELEAAIGRLLELSDGGRADLAARLAALRSCLERERLADGEERHRLGHDLRVPLNAIAGWTHILRLDATTAGTVAHAADVFDRNVRALTHLIEAHTTEAGR